MHQLIRIKVMRLSGLAYTIVIVVLVAAILLLFGRLISVRSEANGYDQESRFSQAKDDSVKPIYKAIISKVIPVRDSESAEDKGVFSSIWNILSFQKLRDPRTIVQCQLPFLTDRTINSTISGGVVAVGKNNNIPDRSAVDRKIIDPPEGEHIDENLPEEVKIKIGAIEVDKKPIELEDPEGGPQILIYHTHSREAYRQDPKNPYEVAEAFRTNDLKHTVISVGEQLTKHLKKKGISVLHDKTEHEQGDYNGAYENSLKTLKKRMKENKSLQIFIDIHRNAYKDGSKSPDDEVVIIDGKRVAKVFVVIGTGDGVMGGFNEKPDWEENYKFGKKLTNAINDLYPDLAKDVYVRSGRFNQHVSTNAILIEVGSTLTTLEEAKRSTKYLAEALSQIVK